MKNQFICVFLYIFFISQPIIAQSSCLNTESNSSNTAGYFDSSNWSSTYWWTNNTEGTISRDTDDFYYGSGSLKTTVSSSDDYINDKVRLWTRAGNCGTAVSSGQSWNISFYIKGEIGGTLEFKLIDDANSYDDSIGDASYTIAYNGWHYMRLNITTTGSANSGDGRLRINFKSPGTFRLDNIVLEQETAFNNWYVDDDGSNSNNGTSPSSAFPSLKKAILLNSSYSPGDLIHVRAGTYQNNGYNVSDETYTSNSDNGSHSNNYAYLNIASGTKYDGDNNGNNNSAGDLVFLDNKNGTINRPIVIRNYIDDNGNHETPKIQFDGSGGIVVGAKTKPINYFELAGFEIQGPNDHITYAEAKDNRDRAVADRIDNTSSTYDDDGNVNGNTASSEGTDTDRSFFHGRGIAVWGGFYINIHNNTVWDCPNSGIRVDNGDYVRLSYNTVYDNTFWSYNAESGIVIAQSLNRDGITNNPTTIKMRIENNIAYGNINKIPYFNPNYECKPEGGFSYDSTSTDYACAGQNYIHDGSGVYITRNRYNSDDTGGSNPNGTDYIGGFLFANNLSYGNGMNGVVVHKTNNASVFNNTVHGNGEVPSIGSTEANYSASGVNWKDALEVGRQNYTGIVVHSSSDANIKNNISWARNTDDKSYVNYLQTTKNWTSTNVDFGSSGSTKNLAGPGVGIAGGNQSLNDNVFEQGDPSFIDASNNSLDSRNYKLSTGSVAAIDKGDGTLTNNLDFDLNNLSRPQGGAYDFGAYEHQNTWTGNVDTNWGNASNWSTNDVPVSGRSPVIANVTNQPVISDDDGSSGNIVLKDITINSSATLTLNKEASLTLSGDLTNNGTVTLNSDSNEFSSLIVQGTSTGDITYKRWIADEGTDEWDLIGSPVAGQTIASFVSGNSSLADHNNQYAIGVFSNDGSTDTAAAMYTNYTQSVIDVDDPDFIPGQGYAMATDEADTPGTTLDFTGTVRTTDLTGVAIDDNTANAANFGKWNLVANPYPSYLNANDDADATASNNFLGVNASNLHSSFAYVYGYNGDGTYTYYNHVTPGSAVYIAPGQGFFVASDDPSGNTIQFTEAMQTVNGSDDFNAENSDIMNDTHEVSLRLYHDNQMIDEAKLFFEESLDLGLDIGYDAGSFSQEAAIMTRLVEEDEGHGMAINAMGLDAMENAVIPLVINQSAGQEFRVNLPTPLKSLVGV